MIPSEMYVPTRPVRVSRERLPTALWSHVRDAYEVSIGELEWSLLGIIQYGMGEALDITTKSTGEVIFTFDYRELRTIKRRIYFERYPDNPLLKIERKRCNSEWWQLIRKYNICPDR